MKIVLACIFLLCLASVPAFAIPVARFMDAGTFLERTKDIIVAECISMVRGQGMGDGIEAAEVNILKTLKGELKPGRVRIATFYPMKPHTTYLLSSVGGYGQDIHFLALQEMSVIPLPPTFRVDDLNDKELKEHVQYVFSRRLFEVERQLAPLLEEKKLLERGISDRSREWYASDGPMKIGPIVEAITQTDKTARIWLDLDGKKLQWSHQSPGKSGFLYFGDMLKPGNPLWEFSSCDAATIEELAGRPLKARFYGMYTPGRGETPLGWKGDNSIEVTVGQVLLARTADDIHKIFIIRIVGQKHDQEQMSVRYTVIHKEGLRL